jgi:hypothetical protein
VRITRCSIPATSAPSHFGKASPRWISGEMAVLFKNSGGYYVSIHDTTGSSVW